jgi:hypothetical protein
MAATLLFPLTPHAQSLSGISLKPFVLSIATQESSDSVAEEESIVLQTEMFTNQQYQAVKVHKALAFTTAGFLVASDIMGTYHYFSMRNKGHDYRDRIGFTEESNDTSAQNGQIRYIWQQKPAQTERIIHTSLIAASAISYTATATIEFTMPRMSKNRSWFSNTNLHKYIVFTHMGLMAANIGLGLAESHALSQGNHGAVQGLGIAHMVVGYAAPVVMVLGGVVFKIPGNY